jgi:glycosyltransferase involved in cell wall biosynthesis
VPEVTRPAVSVIVPAYNAAAFIGDALESALSQTLSPHDVVVVDDGSTDGTHAEVGRFAPHVLCVRQANQGVAAARNHGVAKTRGPLLAFLDADDAWLAHKLEKQVEVFLQNERCVAVGCGLHVTDRDLHVVRTESGNRSTLEDLLLMRGDGGITSGSRVMVTREALLRIGGYAPALSTSADWDLALRLYGVGEVHTLAEPLVFYRQHDLNMHRAVAATEREMRRVLADALKSNPPSRKVRRLAWARLYEILGGSYWVTGERTRTVRCALAAMCYAPLDALRYFGVRLLRRSAGIWIIRTKPS